MGIKKFITFFTLIIFIFLSIAGFVLITYINSQEVKASSEVTDPDNQNPVVSPTPAGFETSWINYPDAFNFMVFVKDVEGYNTDAMMIVNYDPVNKKISTMSLPRDIVYRTIFEKNENGEFVYENGEKKVIKIKINSLYYPEVEKALANGLDRNTGAENAVNVFENFLKINIKYYVTIDLAIFREVIDQLGGVDFYIPADLNYDDPLQNLHIHFNKGMQHLNGQKAEELLRYRKPNDGIYTDDLNKAYPTMGSEIDRINMQQSFFKELIKQKASFMYLTKISSILDVVYDNVETNIDLNSVLDLLKYIPEFDMENISWNVIPGEIVGNDYVYDVDEAAVLIKSNFKGSNK